MGWKTQHLAMAFQCPSQWQFYPTPCGRLGIRHFVEENLTGSLGCRHNFLLAQIQLLNVFSQTWPLWGCCFHRMEVTDSKRQAVISCRKGPRSPVGGVDYHRMKFLYKSSDDKLRSFVTNLAGKGIHSPCKTKNPLQRLPMHPALVFCNHRF